MAGAIPDGNIAGTVPCQVVTPSLVSCEYDGNLPPFGEIEVRIGVVVEPGAKVPTHGVNEELKNTVCVEGGQAPSACTSKPVKLSMEPTPFGVEDYELVNEEEGPTVDQRAGSHPAFISPGICRAIALSRAPNGRYVPRKRHPPTRPDR